MTREELQAEILKLSLEERREFANWFYESEDDLFGFSKDDLSPEWKAEIIRRDKEMRENPSLAIPVTDEYFEQLKKRFSK